MKKLVACLATLILCLPVLSQSNADRIVPIGKWATLKVPGKLISIKREPQDSLQPGFNIKTTGLLSGDNGRVSLRYAYEDSLVDDNGIPAYTDQLINRVKRVWPSARLLDDGILLQAGKNVGYIKFYSRETTGKLFNYMFYMSVDNRPLLLHFSCSKKLMKKWEAVAEDMAASLRPIVDALPQ